MSREQDLADAWQEANGEVLQHLLHHSARWLLNKPDARAFMAHMADNGPRFFPELVAEVPGALRAASDTSSFFRCVAWVIASGMPLPGRNFMPERLPLPGRNEACVCASGRKFKHCCGPAFEHAPRLEPEELALYVVLNLPRKAWAALPGSRVSPFGVLRAALTLADEGEARVAIQLLEPWARQPAPWPAAHAPLLDFLCDLYLDEGHPTKRRRLAQAMVDKGDVPVQSAGWRRLSMMAADAGDAAAARRAFENAQRLTPDEPDVALLEITTLLGSGERERAAERAAFHARRLARLPHAAELADEIGMLEAFGRGEFPSMPGLLDDEEEDPVGAAGGRASLLDPDSPFHQLQRWAQALPSPQLRLRLKGATDADLGELAPAAALSAPLRRWRQAFQLVAPTHAHGSLGPEALEVFVDEGWSALLRREPILADSFEVLDGLLLVLDLLPMGMAADLQALLLQRGLQLWEALRQQRPQARCEWAHLGNRPALRLLVRRVELDGTPTAENCFPWLQALVEVLNPHDNHGLRERLAAVYLRRGDTAAALALCERYPNDFVGMQLLHTRAWLAAQQLPQAAAALKAAQAANAHVIPLLSARRAPRRPDVPSYAVGSVEEARLAVAAQHDLWRAAPVQQWLHAQQHGAPAQGPGLFDA